MKPAPDLKQRQGNKKKCAHCGFTYPDSEVNCTACNRPLDVLPMSNCYRCGISIEPGQSVCDDCELEEKKEGIRPLVITSTLADKRLTKDQKDFIIEVAAKDGTSVKVTESLITDLLSELGATDASGLPLLEVSPGEISFTVLKEGNDAQQYLEIKNAGGGELTGRITSESAWLIIDPPAIDPNFVKQLVKLRVDIGTLLRSSNQEGVLRIESNGGSIDVRVHTVRDTLIKTSTLEDRQANAILSPSGKVKICPQCQGRNDAINNYCTKCRFPLSRDSKSAPFGEICMKCKSENQAGSALCMACGSELHTGTQQKQETGNTAQAPARKEGSGKAIYVLAGVFVLAAVFLVGRVYLNRTSPATRIIEKIDAGQLVTPVGNSAYDMWKELRAKEPDSRHLFEVSRKALPLLRSRGDQHIRRWHDDARPADLDWQEVSRLYEWASMIESEDNHLQAMKNYCYGQIAFREKRFDDAIKSYNQALQYSSCMSLAHNGIGRVHANLKDYSNAEASYKKAMECESQWCYPIANLAGVYLQTYRYSEAESYYKQAIATAQSKPSLHYQLAQLYEALKRHCDAAGEYKIALSLVRNDPDPGFTVERVEKRVNQLAGKCN